MVGPGVLVADEAPAEPPEDAARETEEPEPAWAPALTELAEEPKRFEHPDTRIRLSLEPGLGAAFPGNEPLMLIGIAFDTRLGRWFHIGVGGFGAVKGERGGFFAGGLQGGVRVPVIDRMALEAGMLIGGGGGDNVPVGTGFLLRPSAGLHMDLAGRAGLVTGVSVNAALMAFPNGEVTSPHLVLGADLVWPTIARSGNADRALLPGGREDHGVSARAFRMTGHAYWLTAASDTEETGESMGMFGFEYREWLTRHIFAVLEPRASAIAGTAGYMELTLGAGGELPLDARERLGLFATGSVGAAGGGGVETGEGIFLRGALGLDVNLPGPVRVSVDGGVQGAPTGEITAFSAGLRLGIVEQPVRTRRFAIRDLEPDEEVVPASWRVRVNNQTYIDAPLARSRPMTTTINMIGVKFDHLFNRFLYASGQAATSYTGESSAFSTGAFAIGGYSPDFMGRVRLTAEAKVGAAGGGTVAVGDGIFLQPMGGLQVDITDAYGVEVLGGWKVAPTGELSIGVVEVGLGYEFTTPRLRGR